MGKCAKRAFQNGGQVSKADQLMAEMAAKYGVSGQAPAAPAAPVQQPAPQPRPNVQPLPQQQGITSGIIGILKGRQQQIDKASGYRNGGKIQGPGTPTSDSIPARVNETGEEIRVSNGERIVSAEQGALLEALARKSGFDSLDAMLESGTGKPVGPTMKGGKRAAYNGGIFDKDPLAALSEAIGKNNAAVDAANAGVQKLYPEGTFDKTAKTQAGIAVGAQPTPSVNPLVAGIVDSSFAPAKDRFPLDAKSEFITGKNGAMPDSSGGGFVDGNTAYTVKPTSQDGISRVTAPGKNPLITNIKPESAVAGLNNQTIGQPADQDAQGLARIARAVAINKERIDAQPMGGISVLPDQAAEANAQLDAMRQSSLVSGLSPSQQAAFQQAQAQLAMQGRGQQLTADNARYAADVQAQRAAGHDQVIARGQDLNAQNEERRIAGNPLDNQTKQLSLTQAKRISDLQDKALAGDQSAIKSLQTLSGSDQKGHFTSHVVGGGEDEMGRKLPQRLAIFDSRTGQEVQQGAAQQSGGFGKSDVDAALKAGASKEAVASRIKAMGKNPADFGL